MKPRNGPDLIPSFPLSSLSPVLLQTYSATVGGMLLNPFLFSRVFLVKLEPLALWVPG